ncbi:MAG: imidazole glycerol phosphate synthase subunit HisH [Flammeovirgaceae bacterium]|nr:imidazole glycerol phosphate synthase subunit HisH [Flammeovirgaceae bacterium]
MTVAIIRYNSGNTRSVCNALERLGLSPVVTDRVEDIQQADKVIFPGVGEAQSTMNYLRERKLDRLIKDLKQPVLGVCLGMQLFGKHSDENDTPCLGIIDFEVTRFKTENSVKVPHVGWNQLVQSKEWLLEFENENVYFVHSYFVPVGEYTVACVDYGTPFTAALQQNNFYGVQFHPEKSSETGQQVLLKFLNL